MDKDAILEEGRKGDVLGFVLFEGLRVSKGEKTEVLAQNRPDEKPEDHIRRCG